MLEKVAGNTDYSIESDESERSCWRTACTCITCFKIVPQLFLCIADPCVIPSSDWSAYLTQLIAFYLRRSRQV